MDIPREANPTACASGAYSCTDLNARHVSSSALSAGASVERSVLSCPPRATRRARGSAAPAPSIARRTAPAVASSRSMAVGFW
eukprot:scaffold273994_cov28-Tisochrysis_lutea.AAC.3